MKFKIDLPIDTNPLLDYTIPLLTVGSCFADRMADKLLASRFDVCANPFGVLYNPISIANGLNHDNAQKLLIEHNGLWHSLHHHGQFSEVDKATLTKSIADCSNKVRDRLNQPKTTILVTFGSANVFTYKGEIIANCHKLPSSSFEKRRLTVAEIVTAWTDLLSKYSKHDFIFTVSPVRYTREGMHENNLSKSILHLAVSQLVAEFSNANYFPAYEIVIDELRDYRFYEEDLVHPNSLAVKYVWDALQSTMFTNSTKIMVNDWNEIRQMKEHKLFHPESPAAKKFSDKMSQKMAKFTLKYE